MDTIMHVGDIMSTLGDVHHVGEYHEYIGGCSVCHGFQYKSEAFINLLPHVFLHIKITFSYCNFLCFDRLTVTRF